MTDWKTYKGQNPWSCIAPVDFISYNEGSYIAKSPDVSGGTPTWEIGKTGAVITGVHIPCGYWFKDYDSDAQLRRICIGLEMGYTKTSMVVDEQQTLYVKDVNGDTVDCQITTWSLVGVGSLSGSVGPSVVYTAPSVSIPDADTATITLWCGGVVKDTLVISVAHNCSCVDTILYTTLQMSTSGQQTLQASGGESDDCYAWEVTSGGGSLSSSSGKSVVYTAPSSNANCANNATISLSCGGSVVSHVHIAVNAYTASNVGKFWHYNEIITPCWCNGVVPNRVCYAEGSGYRQIINCDGSSSQMNASAQGSSTLQGDESGACAAAEAMAKAATGNTLEIGVNVWETWYDYRDAAQKALGCCPSQLM